MSIIVEDGSGVANSNSYLSEGGLVAYAAARGRLITDSTAHLLIQAMDYVESLSFKGQKNASDQSLQWPRVGATLDGYEVGSATIPNELKNGLAEVALSIQAGDNPLATLDRETIREKVGELEVEYAKTSSSQAILQSANVKLNKLTTSVGRTIRV
jgi:hypothetical protein